MEYQITRANLQDVFNSLQDELKDNQVLLIETRSAEPTKWGMSRLWRAWMASTAKWMADNGARMPLVLKADGGQYGSRLFSPEDAHHLFSCQWLGVDTDGIRLSWAKAPHDGMRLATKGEKLLAMQKHEAWASERGIILFHPRDSEYQKLTHPTTSQK
jgi:hypothetical protein